MAMFATSLVLWIRGREAFTEVAEEKVSFFRGDLVGSFP